MGIGFDLVEGLPSRGCRSARHGRKSDHSAGVRLDHWGPTRRERLELPLAQIGPSDSFRFRNEHLTHFGMGT